MDPAPNPIAGVPLLPTQRFTLFGLQFRLRSSLPNAAETLARFYAPHLELQPARDESAARDEAPIDILFAHADQRAVDEASRRHREGRRGRPLRLSQHRTAFLRPLEGGGQRLLEPIDGLVIDVSDARRQVALSYSSRTPWPQLKLARLVLEIAQRQMEGRGACLYHAGAVRFGDNVLAILGDKGAGKTTLLAGLLAAGGTLIGNERCFLQPTADGGLRITALPQPVHVGLGTVLAHPGLTPLLEETALLLCPQTRLDRARLAHTPRPGWSGLPDKLSLTPTEFAARAGGPPPRADGLVTALIVPCLEDRDGPDETATPPADEMRALIARNALPRDRDRYLPPWLTLGAPAAAPCNDALRALPACRLPVRLRQGRLQSLPALRHWLAGMETAPPHGGAVGAAPDADGRRAGRHGSPRTGASSSAGDSASAAAAR